MNITLSPFIIVFITIIVCNVLVGFGKSKVMNISYMIGSLILSAMGILGIIIIRPLLIASLNKNLNRGRLDDEFISWAIKKFDVFAMISIIAVSLIMVLLFYLLLVYKINYNGIIWINIPRFVVALRIIILITGIWYGIGTINKRFDLAGYISMLSISEIIALYIPLLIRRIIIYKKIESI